MKKIAVIGSINVDIVFNTDNLPLSGETIFSKSFVTHFGGKGANQAFTVGKLGGDVTFFGRIGNDNYGTDSLANLRDQGCVTTDYVSVSKELSTGLANIIVADNGNNQIIVHSGANFDFPPSYVQKIKETLNAFDIIIFQLEIPINIVEELAIYAHNLGKTVILNPAPAAPLERYNSEKLLQAVDFLIPNETELSLLSGMPITSEESALNAAKHLLRRTSIPHLIVTLGEIGAYYIHNEEIIKIPAKVVKAIDSTCAGDSFIGAFALKISQDTAIQEALTFATEVSAIVVTREGAQSSIPTLAEVATL